ncbi:MAG: hypothetical protein AAFQ34_12085 [Pseudomonadota bacterium]
MDETAKKISSGLIQMAKFAHLRHQHNILRPIRGASCVGPAPLEANFLDEVIPIVFALVICAIVVCAQWLIFRLKRARIEAMKQALIARPDLDPDAITALFGTRQTVQSDLRRAVIALAIGGALAGLALSGFSEFSEAAFVFCAIPIAVSACYFFFAALRLQNKA